MAAIASIIITILIGCWFFYLLWTDDSPRKDDDDYLD
jgi:hypothetical protein